jgi:serine/threonine-protein kinase
MWYVRHTGSDGHLKVSKMSAPQVLQLLKSDRLDLKTQAAVSSKAPFLPLAQIPVFQDEALRLVTRQRAKAREHSLAAAYEKIDRQYRRQKWWRLLARFRDGTLGLVGLILWLAAIGAVIAGAVIAYPYVAEMIASRFHL